MSSESTSKQAECAHHTCLFTGERLTTCTKEEHTIPQCVGGRIKSRYVSCTRFNEAAGRTVDPAISSFYITIFNKLAPLSPGAHGPKMPVTVPGSEDSFEFLPGGIVTLRKPHIERDSQTGEILSVSGPTPRAAQGASHRRT